MRQEQSINESLRNAVDRGISKQVSHDLNNGAYANQTLDIDWAIDQKGVGNTLLMHAVYTQNMTIVKDLVFHGADLNAKNNKGETAIDFITKVYQVYDSSEEGTGHGITRDDDKTVDPQFRQEMLEFAAKYHACENVMNNMAKGFKDKYKDRLSNASLEDIEKAIKDELHSTLESNKLSFQQLFEEYKIDDKMKLGFFDIVNVLIEMVANWVGLDEAKVNILTQNIQQDIHDKLVDLTNNTLDFETKVLGRHTKSVLEERNNPKGQER